MGYQDRDWYKQQPPPSRAPVPAKRGKSVFAMVIAWLAIGGLVYLAVTHFVPGFAPTKVRSEGANELLLRADWSGGYGVAGSINGVPVKFMIDTGASTVSISQAMAQQMGIQGCMGGVSSTANGNVPICMATAKTLVFGPFEAQNVRVAVMPRLEGRALLGMNVLSVLHITQIDGKMVIAAPTQ